MGKAQVSFPVGEGWNVSPPWDDEVIIHLRSSPRERKAAEVVNDSGKGA